MPYWYAIQTISGLEEKTREKLLKYYTDLVTFVPKRELKIRRQAKTRRVLQPLFPGYFFIRLDKPLKLDELREMIQKAGSLGLKKGIIRILGEEGGREEVVSVREEEMQPIIALTGDGEIITFSTFLKEGGKVRIIEGPLKGREVLIKRVNPRKGRITIELEMMGKKNKIDIGGEMVTSLD